MKRQTVGANRDAAVSAFVRVVVACKKVVAARKEADVAWAKAKTASQRFGADCDEVETAYDKAYAARTKARAK